MRMLKTMSSALSGGTWPAALKILIREDNTPFEDEREPAEAEAA